jgi:hypothetical protein
LRLWEQIPPHEIPAGKEDTTPTPVPAGLTVSVYWLRAKLAVTVVAAETMKVHVVALPLQPPPVQPLNVDPALAVA